MQSFLYHHDKGFFLAIVEGIFWWLTGYDMLIHFVLYKPVKNDKTIIRNMIKKIMKAEWRSGSVLGP